MLPACGFGGFGLIGVLDQRLDSVEFFEKAYVHVGKDGCEGLYRQVCILNAAGS